MDAFEPWCWRRPLRVSWTSRRSNQSILKEISPEYSLEGLMLKVKLQSFGHLLWRTDSLERLWFGERLKAGGEGDDREWDGWMASLSQWTWVWASCRYGEGQGSLACCSPWGCKELDTTEWQNNNNNNSNPVTRAKEKSRKTSLSGSSFMLNNLEWPAVRGTQVVYWHFASV